MIPIYLKTIISAEEEINALDDQQFEERFQAIEKRQPNLTAYLDAAIVSFEDEEEFADKFVYYVAVIHQAFLKIKRFFPLIGTDIINQVEQDELKFFDEMDAMTDEEAEIAIDARIANHTQRYLLRYLQAELSDDDEEVDDHINDLNIHIFWLLAGITTMYDKALADSGFDPKDGRDGLDRLEKKEWREEKKAVKKLKIREENFSKDKPKKVLISSKVKSDFEEPIIPKPSIKKEVKPKKNDRDEFFKPRF